MCTYLAGNLWPIHLQISVNQTSDAEFGMSVVINPTHVNGEKVLTCQCESVFVQIYSDHCG